MVVQRMGWRRPESKLVAKDTEILCHFLQRVRRLFAQQAEILWLDECVFHSRHLKQQTWAIKGENHVSNSLTLKHPTLACLAAVSK